MRKYKCSICKYVYDEAKGIPEKGIAAGTKWEDLTENFACPFCGARKSLFEPFDEGAPAAQPSGSGSAHAEPLRELSAGELSAICSNLAKGCEKQRLTAEMEAFYKIADFYKARAGAEKGKSLKDAAQMLEHDMAAGYLAANNAAQSNADRGALRSLVWSEKVSAMLKSLLDRYETEGDAMLANTRIFVCDICGFIYLGNAPPEICPVCKVPSFKILEVERG